MSKIHCFYHSADLDGHCSGAIVKYKHPDAIMHPINYGQEFPWGEIRKEDTVYVVDFCLQPEEQMHNLNAGCRLIWIDHHKSAICAVNTTEKILSGKRNTSKAACELTWEYLFPERPVPLAVKLLSLYDSWTYQGHELEEMVLPFQMRMRMEPLDPKNWGSVLLASCQSVEWFWRTLFGDKIHLLSATMDRFIEEGKLLLRYDEEQKRRYVETYGFETELCVALSKGVEGLCGPGIYHEVFNSIAVNLGHTNSKVFDSVWRRECPHCVGIGIMEDRDEAPAVVCHICHGTGYIEPYDLMITFCRRSDHKWNVSLYSTKPHIDCGAIAKVFGGGGHKGAAGFQCNELPFDY